MSLSSGVKHITHRHEGCLSCSAEQLLLAALIDGKGWVVEVADDFLPLDRRV